MPGSTTVQDRAESLRAQQVQQAEELLFSGPARAGFAKALFRGEFRGDAIFPYPELPETRAADGRGGRGGGARASPMTISTPPRSTAMPIFPARSSTGWPIWACWGWPRPRNGAAGRSRRWATAGSWK